MNHFLKNIVGKLVVIMLALLICVGVIFAFWYSEQPKFHDVTIELGEEFPSIDAFLTSHAAKSLSNFVTQIDTLDLSSAGSQSIVLKHGILKETVALEIVDTTAPVVKFVDVSIHIDDDLTADAFVDNIYDLSDTTVAFAVQPQKPETFGQGTATVVVTDGSGNKTTGICTVEYVWIVPYYELELGEKLEMSDLKPYAKNNDVLSQTWVDMINSEGVGVYTFVSNYGDKSCNCTVTIVDTTPAEVETKDLTVFIGDSVTPEDFITSVTDLSGECTVITDADLATSVVCQKTVQIKVTDSSGNETIKQVQFAVIADVEPPVFSGVETLRVPPGAQIDFNAGVSVTDNADADITYSVDITTVNVDVLGTYYAKYVAVDRAGNRAEAVREVLVLEDSVPPVLSGLTDISVEKNSSLDFTKGVSATDNTDGTIAFTYDTSNLNLTKAGTYYVTYSATDKSGNVATGKRKVVVNYDSSDVDLLVADIAAKLSDDPEQIRDYVRNTIAYNRYWGGDTPVWYGFKNKTGNCYVHALCLQALFNEKGIENMLIWDTDKSHYWNLVKIDGQWKHIDSTPSRPHTTHSLMNDKERYETLISGNWDRSQWPVCN